MDKFGITLQLERVREANEKWRVALAKKNADVEWMMRRLLHEAAHAFMSPEEVATASGYTVKRIRILMRAAGLDPRSGKNLLSKQAAETLAENAELMGIEPQHMDLTSPLAYLPMGEEMRRSLAEQLLTPTTVEDIEVSGNSDLLRRVASIIEEETGRGFDCTGVAQRVINVVQGA